MPSSYRCEARILCIYTKSGQKCFSKRDFTINGAQIYKVITPEIQFHINVIIECVFTFSLRRAHQERRYMYLVCRPDITFVLWYVYNPKLYKLK